MNNNLKWHKMIHKRKHEKLVKKTYLDPEALDLDEATRNRRRILIKMQNMSLEELKELSFRAGIYTRDGELTEHYRD